MMAELTIMIPGEPCAQGRPRFSTAGGFVKAYDPVKSRNYKAFVRMIAQKEIDKQGWKYTELPLTVTITAYARFHQVSQKNLSRRLLRGLNAQQRNLILIIFSNA